MVLQMESNRSNTSLTPRNWFSRRKCKQSKDTTRRPTVCGSFCSKFASQIIRTGKVNSSSGSMEESYMLRKKIKKIEKQNYAQQRRLQQLEKLVMQLSHNRTLQMLPCLPADIPAPSPGAHRLVTEEREQKLPPQTECEDQDYDCRDDGGDGLTKDLASLMEEFDRNGRENGMVYGVTPSHSFADSDDLAVADGTAGVPLSRDVCKLASLSEDVCSSPLPIFITPTYEDWTNDKSIKNNFKDSKEPQCPPRPCFTTPVLLTTDALKEAEQCLNEEDSTSPLDPKKWSTILRGESKGVTSSKITPFFNLLTWIHQTPNPNTKQCRASEKGRYPVRDLPGPLSIRRPPGLCSPGNESVGSASDRVRKWSQSLRLPFLSPMPESLCSDREANTSDEEELVVDEAVSHSVAVGRRGQQQWQRKRNESVCSFAGPCVAPDLLLTPDSGGTCLGQVREEDIMTEIAGELEGSMLIEEPQIQLEDLAASLRHFRERAEEQEKNDEEEAGVHRRGGKRGKDPSETLEVESVLAITDEKEESYQRVKSQPGIEGLKSDKIESEASGVEAPSKSSTIAMERKEVKLPAGSVVLAMVDEAGSLVPLPQFQVDPQALSGALDHASEDDVDVETISERTPVLEAGDLASLLAQFEASEAVNTPGSDNPGPVCVVVGGTQKQPPLAVATDNLQALNSGTPQHKKPSQASPTHQNIKDALPKEIIEKIKASTKRKSTQMLSEPVAMRKGRGTKSETSNVHRSKGSRAALQQPQPQAAAQQNEKDLRVPPPLDHDYCCSSDKTEGSGRLPSDCLYNKLPDYYTTVPMKNDNTNKSCTSLDDGQDDVGKKDSGVESGDVSDASVETEDRKREGKDSRKQQDPTSTSNERKKSEKVDNDDIYNKLPAYMTDIGNAKPKENGTQEASGEVKAEDEEEIAIQKQEGTKKHKRKLNLSEYRQRIKSAQSSRCPSPASSTTSTVASSPQQTVEGTTILMQAKAEEKDDLNTAKEPLLQTAPEEDMEEGELEGDSEPEVLTRVNPGAMNTEGSSGATHAPLDSRTRGGENTLGSLVFYRNSSAKPDTHWKVGSHQGLSSRRWSSSSRSRSRSRSKSRSRSRSHSRSPVLNKKRHSRRHRHSSHSKRRRGYRGSRSSQSPRPWRRWSRSRSHSRSRGSSSSSGSSSHSHSFSSSRSRSRSRSRSCSSKTKDRWGYWHWGSGRKRRSSIGSQSVSSSRYRVTRSRSPVWRSAGRSRSPSRTLHGRPRRAEEENRVKQVEERRVIYIGRICEGTTKAELRTRFEKYGTIVDISVHFRERGDNYGFVTYKSRDEAYFAVEHGNDDPSLPRYDLCFGGRRAFCKVSYSDLDAQPAEPSYPGGGSMARPADPLDFDSLLRAAMKRSLR